MSMLRTVPEELGGTKLAYITDNEKKLLRRREAMKGYPSKTTTEGIPVLKDSGLKSKKQGQRLAAKKGYKEQYTKSASKKKDYKTYVKQNADLKAAYQKIKSDPESEEAKYWAPRMQGTSQAAFGKAHAGESKALETGKYRGATKAMGQKARSVPGFKPVVTKPGPDDDDDDNGDHPVVTRPGPDPTNITAVQDMDITGVFNQDQLNSAILDEMVMYGPKSEVVQERITAMINTNSGLFKAATTKALQSMNAAGLANTSMAQEAVMMAVMAVALPIAERDALAFSKQRQLNQDYGNVFAAAQNKAFYDAFVVRLQGQVQQTLRQLTDRSANWRAILNARAQISMTPNMGKSAAENAMKAVTPTWF